MVRKGMKYVCTAVVQHYLITLNCYLEHHQHASSYL